MLDTRPAFGFHWPFAAQSVESRLDWLLKENEREATRRLFRNAHEEEEMLLMRRPLRTARAYALFGLLLGIFPPLAIFFRIIYEMARRGMIELKFGLFALFLLMVTVCSLVGRAMGKVVGKWFDNNAKVSFTIGLMRALIAGIAWGAVTGAAGGAPAFLIGGIFGQLCAIMVGILAFPIFSLLHRLLARGGMIDARHFWPLACGVVMGITALILGL